MTILHNEKQTLSLVGLQSESHCCIDCGYNTFPGAPPRELAEFLMNRDGTHPLTITDDCEIYKTLTAAMYSTARESRALIV